MEKLTTLQLVEILEECNMWNGAYDNFRAYDMEEINEMLHAFEPEEIVRLVQNGFNLGNDKFRFGMYELKDLSNKEYYNEVEDLREDIIETAKEIALEYGYMRELLKEYGVIE